MHHFGFALSIALVEEVEHVFFELLTIPVDIFSCLSGHQLTAHA